MNAQELAMIENDWSELICETFPSVSAVFAMADGSGIIVNSKKRADLVKISELLARVGMTETQLLDPSPFLDAYALYLVRA